MMSRLGFVPTHLTSPMQPKMDTDVLVKAVEASTVTAAFLHDGGKVDMNKLVVSCTA
jgi:hypothetical protein